MIERIVRDISKEIYEPVERIVEKFNYYRQLSSVGLHKLSNVDYEALQKEFNSFMNLELAFGGATYPTKLFRVTNNKIFNQTNPPYKLQKISNLTGPPIGVATINRCNLKEESVFYAALDFLTALWETQPQPGDVITVSEWAIKPGQNVNNHFIFHPIETNRSKESIDTYEAHLIARSSIHPALAPIYTEVMRFFADEFMKPVAEDQKKNYLFSAVISSRFLQGPRDENGKKIESISYPSIKRDHMVTNIAILNSLVLEKLDLTAATIHTVGESNYGDECKDRDDFIKTRQFRTYHKSFDFNNDQIYWDIERELRDAIAVDRSKYKRLSRN